MEHIFNNDFQILMRCITSGWKPEDTTVWAIPNNMTIIDCVLNLVENPNNKYLFLTSREIENLKVGSSLYQSILYYSIIMNKPEIIDILVIQTSIEIEISDIIKAVHIGQIGMIKILVENYNGESKYSIFSALISIALTRYPDNKDTYFKIISYLLTRMCSPENKNFGLHLFSCIDEIQRYNSSGKYLPLENLFYKYIGKI